MLLCTVAEKAKSTELPASGLFRMSCSCSCSRNESDAGSGRPSSQQQRGERGSSSLLIGSSPISSGSICDPSTYDTDSIFRLVVHSGAKTCVRLSGRLESRKRDRKRDGERASKRGLEDDRFHIRVVLASRTENYVRAAGRCSWHTS